MEFHEKMQELRKQKGLTQEELAERLYVSRAAVSKWESGRGYPSIDSLKAIAQFYSVTIDELLRSTEVLTLAEDDKKQRDAWFCDLVFGLLDCCGVLFLFLPFFGYKADGVIREVSLPSLAGVQTYIMIAYWTVAAGMVALGILTLALQNASGAFWVRNKRKLSFLLHAFGVLLFTVSLQPYAAAFLFVFLMIKTLLLIKKQ